MNLRCSYCQMPFTIGQSQMLVALQTLQDESLHHYDAHCPHCRKANQISRDRLEHFLPNWREALAAESSPAQEAAPEPATDAAKPAQKAKKTTPEPAKDAAKPAKKAKKTTE